VFRIPDLREFYQNDECKREQKLDVNALIFSCTYLEMILEMEYLKKAILNFLKFVQVGRVSIHFLEKFPKKKIPITPAITVILTLKHNNVFGLTK